MTPHEWAVQLAERMQKFPDVDVAVHARRILDDALAERTNLHAKFALDVAESLSTEDRTHEMKIRISTARAIAAAILGKQ